MLQLISRRRELSGLPLRGELVSILQLLTRRGSSWRNRARGFDDTKQRHHGGVALRRTRQRLPQPFARWCSAHRREIVGIAGPDRIAAEELLVLIALARLECRFAGRGIDRVT